MTPTQNNRSGGENKRQYPIVGGGSGNVSPAKIRKDAPRQRQQPDSRGSRAAGTQPQPPPRLHRMPRNYTPDIQRIGTDKEKGSSKKTRDTGNPVQKQRAQGGRVRKKRKKTTLAGAVFAELQDMLDDMSLIIPFTADQFVRGIICATLIVLFAMLQTTVFSRFQPFGAIPDLMFTLTVAIAFSEGEKWGGVCGLVCAVVIDSLTGVGLSLLPILYMLAGALCGYLVRDFFSNTALPRIAVITLFTFGRSFVTLISAVFISDAPITDILLDMVIPEYFSTVLMSAPVYLAVWLCFVKFHKTRAERTAG